MSERYPIFEQQATGLLSILSLHQDGTKEKFPLEKFSALSFSLYKQFTTIVWPIFFLLYFNFIFFLLFCFDQYVGNKYTCNEFCQSCYLLKPLQKNNIRLTCPACVFLPSLLVLLSQASLGSIHYRYPKLKLAINQINIFSAKISCIPNCSYNCTHLLVILHLLKITHINLIC